MMRYMGIDPGKDGGIVVISELSSIIMTAKPPLLVGRKGTRSEYDIGMMAKLLGTALEESLGGLHIVLEKTQALPRKMGGSAANYQRGFSLGLWLGLINALKLPHTVVAPQTWQRMMFCDVRQTDTKQASGIVAARLWPGHDWRRTEKCKRTDDGLTDAALLAEYGRRMLQGLIEAKRA